jgi:adenylate cyclase
MIASVGIEAGQGRGSMASPEIKRHESKLQALRDEGAPPVQLVDTLNDLAFAFYRIDPEASERHAREAFEMARQANYPSGLGRSQSIQGISRWVRGDFDEALEFFEEGLRIYQASEDKSGIASSYTNMGLVFSGKGDPNQALDYFLKALAISEDEGDAEKIARIHNNIGIIYKNRLNYDRALEHLHAAAALFEQEGNQMGMAGIYNNLAVIKERLGELDTALEYFFKSMELRVEAGEKGTIAASFNNIGDVYKGQGNYAKALEYLNRSLEIKKEIGDKHGIVTTKTGIGDVFHMQGDHAAAQDHFERALRIAEEIGAKRQEMLCHQRLSKLHESLGEFERSLAYHKSFTKMDRSLFSDDQNRQLAEIQTKYETEKKEKEAEIYRLRNVELQAAYDKNDELLRNILPGEVVEELAETSAPAPRIVDDATIVFIDIVGFTLATNESEPEKLLRELSRHFGAFDEIVKEHGLEKLKTFGDGYMYAGGLFADSNQLGACVEAAVEILEFVEAGNWDLRIGIHRGPCIAGLIKGWRMIYDVWGETVNLAARLEENGEAGRINVSQAVHDELAGGFDLEPRGEIPAHNIGPTPMYFLKLAR